MNIILIADAAASIQSDFDSVFAIAAGIGFVIMLLRIFNRREHRNCWQGLFRKSGEARVSSRLQGLPEGYTIINDVMLNTVDGTTTQVDHVVVSKYGIFVIETKDYDGWIFGSEKSREWTETFPSGRWGGSEKFSFQNPIRQNWRHIYTLSERLKLPLLYFKNVVVFCGEGEFKSEMPEYVMYSHDLREYITSFDRPLLSEEMVAKIAQMIVAQDGGVSDADRASHVRNLHARHDPDSLSVMFSKGELKCPRCGAPMVLRKRKADGVPFYGCSKYPACKGIVNAG